MISLLKHEPSAQSPWQNTILFFVFGIFVSFDFDSVYLATFKAIHPRQSRLTGIRLQRAIYFCLHRGSLLENTASWQACSHARHDDGKRFVVRADEILTAFMDLGAAIRGN